VRFHASPTRRVRVQALECGPKLVPDREHLALLQQGVDVWNDWRANEPSIRPDLSEANLKGAKLGSLGHGADLSMANLIGADLIGADLVGANLIGADLRGAKLIKSKLILANLSEANLSEANLSEANLSEANLFGAVFSGADLSMANLLGANLTDANLGRVNVSKADLQVSILLGTDFTGADLTGCRVYGASAWGLKLERTKQQNLVITPAQEPQIAVDSIEVAQFVYLLLNNDKIRDVIDTVGRKGVLLLGRFTEGRIAVLDRLRDELRKRGYLPIVFNFDKSETKDFTETVRLLAGMSKFVIADITNPKSAPLELQATIPEIMVPFQPIIERGEKPFAMLQDLWIKHRDWVFEPIEYSSVDRLVETMNAEIIEPAEKRFDELVMRRAETLKVRRV
jgi:uncharacterized protein YjbI with pentapeptide repeats